MFGFILGIWTIFGILLFKKNWRLWYFHKIDRMQEVLHDTLKSISSSESSSSMIKEELDSSYEFSSTRLTNWDSSEVATFSEQTN